MRLNKFEHCFPQVLSIGQTLLVYVIIGAAMATSLVLFAMEAAAWRLKARRKREQEEQQQQHPLLWWQQQEHQQINVKRYHQVRIGDSTSNQSGDIRSNFRKVKCDYFLR